MSQNECDSSNFSNDPIANANFAPLAFSNELYVRSNAVVSRLVAGEMIVLPIRNNVGDLTSLFSFNRTGATIWNALESPTTLQDICAVIDRKYDLSGMNMEQDVRIFVSELCSLGLAKALGGPENAPANEKASPRTIPTAPG
jgi:coenzyme PQQ synthesis protein D (PqqD)